MTNYQQRLDAETWAFIDKTNSFYPAGTVDLTLGEQRTLYDRMCRAFHAGHPQGVSAETSAIETPARAIPIRRYRAGQGDRRALVLYFHGGGFILGGLDSHDDVCAELCGRTGYEVVSVDYRLAPEHLHPAAFDDAMAAFEWAAQDGRAVVLAGDSAGGNLAAAVSHASRGHPRPPVGQVLIYPGLGGDMSRGSYLTHAEAPMLTTSDIRFYGATRTGGADRTGDITLAPLADADFANLPPSVIVTAECDPRASDGLAYCERITAAGGRCLWVEEPGLVHGYLRARHMVGRARTSFSRIVEAVGALGRGEWVW